MKIPVTIRGTVRTVDASAPNGTMKLVIDGRSIEGDVIAISPGLYSILLNGRSFEAHVTELTGDDALVTIDGNEFPVSIGDPRRWQRDRGAALEAEGRQRVTAPMPGKVVRVLVVPGQTVKAGQGLAVVEAMKMQNEVRSPKAGTVERLLVTDGQAVNGGETLAIVS